MTNIFSVAQPVVGLILNYRDAKRTLRCVRSLLDDGLAHVLVWDNSEDDGQSASELRTLLAGEVRVEVRISKHNLGFAAGVNRGKERICENFPGSWILLINNDAELFTGATAAMTKALQGAPEAVIAYPTIDHGGRCVGAAFYQRHFGFVTRRRLLGSIIHASGCCQLLSSERLSGAWFDEDFFMYGEDVELGYRLGEKGILHVPEVWVRHEGSASSGMGSVFYETRMVMAHWILAKKLARNGFELGLFYFARSVSLGSRALVRAFRYRSWTPLKSLLSGWVGLRMP